MSCKEVEQLAQLMVDYNLGCATQQIYELKKNDSDYFGESKAVGQLANLEMS